MDFFIEKFISRAQPKLTSEELFAKVNSPQVLFSPNAHSALWTICKWFVLNFKGDRDQLAALGFETNLWWLCERSRKMFSMFSFLILCPHHYNYCKIETKCDPTKLIQILNIFYKHGVSCILVIVHRILREYQNWTELKLTHEWSCENKLYLQFIRML